MRLLDNEKWELADHVEEDNEDHKYEDEGEVQTVLAYLGRGTCIKQNITCIQQKGKLEITWQAC